MVEGDSNELKRRALEFCRENDLPRLIERALNEVFLAYSQDPLAYMSKFFEGYCNRPSVTSIRYLDDYDEKCRSVKLIQVAGNWKGDDEILGQVAFNFESNLESDEENEDWNFEQYLETIFLEHFRERTVDKDDVIEMNSKFRSLYHEMLLNQSQYDDEKIDEKLHVEAEVKKSTGKSKAGRRKTPHPKAPPSLMTTLSLPAARPLSALSTALLISAANSCRPPEPLHQFVQRLVSDFQNDHVTPEMIGSRSKIPTLLVSLLTVSSKGNCRCIQDIFLIPEHGDLSPEELYHQLFKVAHQMNNLLPEKNEVTSMINEDGSLAYAIESPQQGIDSILRCLDRIHSDNEFAIGLHLRGQAIFNKTKGLYEPSAGMFKTPDEQAEYYIELLKKYPIIKMLIDPFRREDKSAWEILSSHCGTRVQLVVSTSALSSDGKLKNRSTYHSSDPQINEVCRDVDEAVSETDNEFIPASSYTTWMFDARADLDCFFVTELIPALNRLKNIQKKTIFDMDYIMTPETWPVELAFGLDIDYMKLGGLLNFSQAEKLRHWVKIANEKSGGTTTSKK